MKPLLIASLLLLSSRGAEPIVVQATEAPEWNDRFAGKEGWIGGDGVCSIAFDSGRIVWLFGDSLIGKVKEQRRISEAFVNNTVGVQDNASSSIRFVTGKKADGKPAAFLTPADGKGYFWPQSGAHIGTRLYLFLPQIESTKEPGAFGFRHVGQWLAIVDNPDAEPEQWQIRQHQLPNVLYEKRHEISWGSAVLLDQDDLYVYGYEEKGKGLGRRQLLVAKVPAVSISDFTTWRYRTKEGWSTEAKDAVPLGAGLATEFSVIRLKELSDFLAIYSENGLSDRIFARHATTPAGPWSAPILLYRSPETGKDKGVFTYAAKVHAFASSPKRLLLSYCTNTWEFGQLFRDQSLYRPKFVYVELK